MKHYLISGFSKEFQEWKPLGIQSTLEAAVERAKLYKECNYIIIESWQEDGIHEIEMSLQFQDQQLVESKQLSFRNN